MSAVTAFADAALSTLQIDYSDDMTAEQRQDAERSVAALVARSAEGRAQQRAVDQCKAEVDKAMTAPLLKMINSDPDAARELKEASRRLSENVPRHLEVRDPIWPVVPPPEMALEEDVPGVEIFPLPFHFAWQWHNGQSPAVSEVDRNSGRFRVGSGVDGDQFTDIHAGFGVSLPPVNQVKTVTARSLRTSGHKHLVSTGPVGGAATTEGGTEITVFENDTLVGFAQDKQWRKRVSNGESDSYDDGGGQATGATIEVTWTMRPGFRYTLNVGGWVFLETRDSLIGLSYAQGDHYGKVIFMSLFGRNV